MEAIEKQIEFNSINIIMCKREIEQHEKQLAQAETLIRYYGKALANFKEYGKAVFVCFGEDFCREQYNAAFDQKENAQKWITELAEDIHHYNAVIDELMRKQFAMQKVAEQNWLHDKKYITGSQLQLI